MKFQVVRKEVKPQISLTFSNIQSVVSINEVRGKSSEAWRYAKRLKKRVERLKIIESHCLLQNLHHEQNLIQKLCTSIKPQSNEILNV